MTEQGAFEAAYKLLDDAICAANKAKRGEALLADKALAEWATSIRGLLDQFRLCSECGGPTGLAADVCNDCWPAYQERMRAEDDEEGERRWREEHICAECGRGLGPNDGDLCVRCVEEARDEARDRDWEQEQRVVDEAWTDMMVGQGEE